MLPALRTLASSKLAWHRIATTLAPGAVATTHARQRTNAEGQSFTQLVTRAPRYLVGNGAYVTGERLLTMALANARRVTATPQLWSQVVMTDAGVPELPPLYTSGRELGQKRRLTERTIRNHVRELKACGFITRYQFRGREHAYCLWINPDYVWETAPVPVTGSELASSIAPAGKPYGTNFPVREVLEPLEPLKSDITRVEKLVTHEAPAGAPETGTPLTGTAGLPRSCEPAVQATKEGAGAAGAARRARFYQQAADKGTGAKKAEAKRLVEWFWSYAKTLIYTHQTFTPEAERLAKNAIWHGVFFGFHEGEPADWQAWLPGLQRRVELAAAWLKRHPSHYPPLPYAEVISGRGYFDADNQHGFAGTRAWWHKEAERRAKGYKRLGSVDALTRALDEALLELTQRRRLDAGERRVQASKRAKATRLPELHRFHHTKLARLGGQDALHRFAARLQAEHLLSLS